MSKICPNCNKELPEEASFCLNCFTKLNVVQQNLSTENKKSNRKKLFNFAFAAAAVIVLSVAIVSFSVSGKSNAQRQKVTAAASAAVQTSATEQVGTSSAQTAAETSQQQTTASTSASETKTTQQSQTQQTTATTEKTSKAAASETGTFKYSGYGNGIIITSYSGSQSNVTLPDKIDGKTVLAVGEKAFSDNKHIKYLTIEGSSKSLYIKKNAFYNLSAVKKINFPQGVDVDSFVSCIVKCPELESVNISSSSSRYTSSDGVIYSNSSDGVTLCLYPAGKTDSSFKIPYKVTAVSDFAFCGNSHLKKIKFSKRESVDINWEKMFSSKNLKSLETIDIYPGTDADIKGIQYFSGEIDYYD